MSLWIKVLLGQYFFSVWINGIINALRLLWDKFETKTTKIYSIIVFGIGEYMYSFIRGNIVEIQRDHVILENHGIGYIVYVSNPYAFEKKQEITIYVHQQVKEDAMVLFGFKSKEEKDLFLKLILVKGIGCKTAIGILAVGDIPAIVSAIETGNVAYLKKIPGIGPKAAQQIILDLQGKFKGTAEIVNQTNQELEEAGEVLLALGYKRSEVDKAMATLLQEHLDTNGYVKKALSVLVK